MRKPHLSSIMMTRGRPPSSPSQSELSDHSSFQFNSVRLASHPGDRKPSNMRQLLLSAFYLPLSLISPPTTTTRHCKTSPQNQTWPSNEEWHALNESIGGTLLRTAPAASSCYDGNPLNSPYDCASVKKGWKFGAYHASWPESIDHPIFTNNSCIPPGADGYDEKRGCSIGALPQYIVNATTEEQVAMAMEWASKRDARIVVKSTGHDFNGRYVILFVYTGGLCHADIEITDRLAHTPCPSGHTISTISNTTPNGASPEARIPLMF